ncbi:hypothetical protein TIFTF001_045886 [Ficus carica]|uniref:Uncharacterized protein n=1 Tax=Ficus carica TaxID=3494 RepID=A0AA87Z3X9_FICCA|nr:hypothetical protein TIFTF001_045886 [Ficus carica]
MVGFAQSLNIWSPAKKKHLRSDLDTSGVSANDTPMLKSVVVLVSKQRCRALTRKNCPYLNRWADPLFIGVPRGLGCSGDPVGLNSKCSRRVDMLQVHRHRTSNRLAPRVPMAAGAGDTTGAVASGVRCQAADAECRVGRLLSACTG